MSKQKIFRRAIQVLFLSLIAIAGFAQTNQADLPKLEAISWKNVANFSSGVLSIADTGNSLLVGAGGKIHRSTDGGNTWIESNTGNTINAPTGFAMLGTKIFVAGANLIEVSTNDGQSWAKAADLVGANMLAVYNNTLYATTLAGRGIYRSTDGTTWTRIFQPTTSMTLTSFTAVDGVFVVASDLSGLFRSTDNGATWANVKTGACSGVSASGNTLYASFLDGVYRSRDKGANWVRTNLYSLQAASSPGVDGNKIYVRDTMSFPDDMKYSPDQGYNWFSATAPASFVTNILARPGFVLAGTLLGGLYLGTQLDTLPPAPPSGSYWENLASLKTFSNTISAVYPLQLYAFGNTLFVNNNGRLMRSNNFGLTWEDKTPANARLNISVQNGTQLAAGSKYIFMASDGALYRSNDNGATWQAAPGISSSCVWVFAKGETVFTYASSRFYRSADSGSTWTEITSAVATNVDGVIAVGSTLLRFDRGGAVNKSTDDGVTWTKVTTTGLPTPVVSSNTSTFSSMAANSGTIFVNVRNSSQPGIYKSTNEGQTWAKITATVGSLTNPPIAGNLLYDGKNLLLITEGGKNTLGNTVYDIYLATDGGQTYAKLNANTVNFTMYDSVNIAMIGSKIFQVNYSSDFWVSTGSIITPQSTVSAATYVADSATPEGIASAFGTGMTIFTDAASAIPLPTSLGDVQVKVKDSAGVERLAGLFYVSPTQVNYQIPAGTAPGTAMVTVLSANGATVANGNVTVSTVAPGLFTSNMDGAGVPAALVQRFGAGGAMAYEAIGAKDGTGKYIPTPIDLGPTTDQVYLGLFGTGVRGRSDLSNVSVTIGGQTVPVSYASAQGYFVGLDQINILIPRSLIGKGETDLVLTVDGKVANTVRVNIK